MFFSFVSFHDVAVYSIT